MWVHGLGGGVCQGLRPDPAQSRDPQPYTPHHNTLHPILTPTPATGVECTRAHQPVNLFFTICCKIKLTGLWVN